MSRLKFKQLADGSQSISGTGIITLASGSILRIDTATISNDADIVNKEYVDSVAAGLDPKESVRVATTAVLSGTMIADDGTPSSGERAYNVSNQTIEWFATEGPTSIDGVTLTNGDRILVKDESATSGPSSGEGRIYNGIYVRTSQDLWTRAEDQNGSPSNEVSGGNFTFVEQGTANENKGYVLQGDGELTLQTDNLIWVQFSQAAAVTGGDGIDVTSSVISVDLDGTSNGTSGLKVGASGLAISDNLGGDGISQTNGVLALDLNELTGATVDPAADSFAFLDATDSTTKLESIADLMTAVAGNGLTAASGVLAVDITEFTTDTSVGATDVLAIHDGAMKQITFANFESSLSLENIQAGSAAGQVMIWDDTAGTWDNATLSLATGDRAGLSIVNADGSITIGVNIEGGTAIGEALAATDAVLVYNVSGDANVTATMSDIATYVDGTLTYDNYVSWTLSDGSNTETIASGNTVTLTDSNGISITVGATDTATFTLVADATGGANLASVIDLNSNGIAIRVDDITIEDDGNGGTAQLRVKQGGIGAEHLDSDGSNTPLGNGTSGQVLSSNGDGSFSWANDSGATERRTRTTSENASSGSDVVAITDVFGTDSPRTTGIPSVYINGALQYVGDGTFTADVYFSDDGGTTAESFATLTGDEDLYFSPTNAGFEIATDDVVEVRYSV